MYKLNQGDIQDIEMFKNIERAILEVYYSLYELEKDGGFGTPEFQVQIERLKALKQSEDSITSRVFATKEQTQSVMEKLGEKYDFPKDDTCFAYQAGPLASKDELLGQRIVNETLRHFLAATMESQKEEIKCATIDPAEKCVKEAAIALSTSENFILSDHLRVGLAIMATINNPNVKNQLLWMKYGMAYALFDLEQDLISNNFAIRPNPYLTYPLLEKMYPQINIGLAMATVNGSAFSIALSKIARHTDFDLIYPDSMANVLFQSAAMRASIVLLNDEDASPLIDDINKIIESLMGNPSKSVVIKILQDVVDSRKKDREMLQIVTLSL